MHLSCTNAFLKLPDGFPEYLNSLYRHCSALALLHRCWLSPCVCDLSSQNRAARWKKCTPEFQDPMCSTTVSYWGMYQQDSKQHGWHLMCLNRLSILPRPLLLQVECLGTPQTAVCQFTIFNWLQRPLPRCMQKIKAFYFMKIKKKPQSFYTKAKKLITKENRLPNWEIHFTYVMLNSISWSQLKSFQHWWIIHWLVGYFHRSP